MRPLGAVVLGAYVDKHGRRAGLILTLSLMAVGTMVIALTPAYRTIGIVAPIVVVIGRLLQGFSAGVGVGGASIYLSEMATPGPSGILLCMAVGEPAGCCRFRGAAGSGAQCGCAARGDGSVGMARAIFHRLPDRAAVVLVAQIAWMKRKRFSAAKRHPGISAGPRLACVANWKIVGHRRVAFHHDDGEFLSHHRVHAHLLG